VNRRLTLLSGALLATLALSSCGLSGGRSGDVVAQVNGHELTSEELRTLTDGSTEGGEVRAAIAYWIRVVSVLDDPTGVASPETGPARSDAALALVVAEHSESGREVYERGLTGSPLLCLRAIPLELGVSGQQVLDEINAGLSFEDAAAQYSTNVGLAESGGVMLAAGQECLESAALQQGQPDFFQVLVEADATVGRPVVLTFADGEAIALLRPYDDAPMYARNQLSAEEVSLALRTKFYEPADVYVSPRYGLWNAERGEVVPFSGE